MSHVLGRGLRALVLLGLLACCVAGDLSAGELAPLRLEPAVSRDDAPLGVYAERTIVAALEIDRDQAVLLGYTVKPRPFVLPLTPDAPRAYEQGRPIQVEVTLADARGTRFTRSVEVGPLCLTHAASSEAHIAGDTILLHRDTFLVELPEVAGLDSLEVAYHETARGTLTRTVVGQHRLDAAHFQRAAGSLGFGDLAFALAPSVTPPASAPAAATALWPEDFADPDLYRVYGDESETAQRVNVVIVPDGYTYAEKALMETHADDVVAYFRAKTPYKEHDPLINYTLVYAYSQNSGTDQCDCGIVVDTAMGTRFLEATPTCGHSDNRCLYYGGGCDTSGASNIATAELRAPAKDTTIVMVNTSRYGGCGGSRAVYSAANSSAVEVAVHELGHSLAGLADEYSYTASCGVYAGGINTSTNPSKGTWPEWITEIGQPHEGAQYYQQCLYRPQANCNMRSLNQPFCVVCNQHYALTFFGHFRVAPTAPLTSSTPASPTTAYVGVPQPFSVTTRFGAGTGVTNEIKWRISGPGFPGETVVATNVASHEQTFGQAGTYTVTCEVVADTNFIKPVRYAANRDSVSWTVDVIELAPPAEVSGPGAAVPLTLPDRDSIAWEDASATGSFSYNLYRGALDELASGSYGACQQQAIEQTSAQIPETPPPTAGWFYLVAGSNPVGEGPLGLDSAGNPRLSQFPCN